VRTSELIESQWPEFDLGNARWDIPAERMKMDTPHIVPLSRQAVGVLRALMLLTGKGKFVLPGANDKNKLMSNNTRPSPPALGIRCYASIARVFRQVRHPSG
jgi:integrase